MTCCRVAATEGGTAGKLGFVAAAVLSDGAMEGGWVQGMQVGIEHCSAKWATKLAWCAGHARAASWMCGSASHTQDLEAQS